jgi:uncharacterized SAM-binding protein YcdF (DUF218 family)
VRRRLSFFTVIVAMAVLNALLCASGFLIFDRAVTSSLEKADAIVVLAGEHDGREEYGISLAQRGLASTVVLSDPYRRDDPLMRRLCNDRYSRIHVTCVRPPQTSTGGEAVMTRDLAVHGRWAKITVVTWRFHIPRARYIFGRCLPPGMSSSYVAVPRQYAYSVAAWNSQYLYQYGAFVKALTTSSCR